MALSKSDRLFIVAVTLIVHIALGLLYIAEICLCLGMLTSVTQIVTATHRDL